uniref:uncharacterized protein isoform X2 n=1 Tax=Semicossyphus pulcher TaxID=241346 RepID=UPI0037E90DDF
MVTMFLLNPAALLFIQLLFTCQVFAEIGADIGSLWYFVYILTSVIGLFLLGIVSVVCLCRRMRAKTPNQEQIHLESAAAENQLPQTQSGAERRTNNKRRSQYMERLNSIYAAY